MAGEKTDEQRVAELDKAIKEMEKPKAQPVLRHLEERVPRNEKEEKARLAWLKARCGLELPKLPKDSKADRYMYASLPDILGLLDKPLRQAGFVVRFAVWKPHSSLMGVRCVLTHVEGWYECCEFIGSPKTMIGGRMSEFQMHGAFQTYGCRYALLGCLGWTADVDTDASSDPDSNIRDDTPPQQQRGGGKGGRRQQQPPPAEDDGFSGPDGFGPDF